MKQMQYFFMQRLGVIFLRPKRVLTKNFSIRELVALFEERVVFLEVKEVNEYLFLSIYKKVSVERNAVECNVGINTVKKYPKNTSFIHKN